MIIQKILLSESFLIIFILLSFEALPDAAQELGRPGGVLLRLYQLAVQ